MCNDIKLHPFIQIINFTFEYCLHLDILRVWIHVTRIVDFTYIYIFFFFYLIYGRRLKQGEELVCSMTPRSESAALRNSDNKNDSL